jgi:hypothetical protein
MYLWGAQIYGSALTGPLNPAYLRPPPRESQACAVEYDDKS